MKQARRGRHAHQRRHFRTATGLAIDHDAIGIADRLILSGAIDVVVIDSVAALVPKSELEGEMGDAHMGLQARLMSQALRKLTAAISKSQTTLIFINQIRMKIGVMFGNPETTTGGNALKFYASVRMDIRRIGALKDGDKVEVINLPAAEKAVAAAPEGVDREVLEGGHPVAPPVAPFVGDLLEVARASKLLGAEAFGHLACELRDVTLLGCLDEDSLHAERLQLGRSRSAAFRIPLNPRHVRTLGDLGPRISPSTPK